MEPDHGRVVLVCVSGGSWDDPEHKSFVNVLCRELERQGYGSEVSGLGEFRKLLSSGVTTTASGAFVRIVLGEVAPYSDHATEESWLRDLKAPNPDLIGIVLDDPSVVFERILSVGLDVTPGSAHEWMRAAVREVQELVGTTGVRIRPLTLAQPLELANLITESEEPPASIPHTWGLGLPNFAERDRTGCVQGSLFPSRSSIAVAARVSTSSSAAVPPLPVRNLDRTAREDEVRTVLRAAFGSRIEEISTKHFELAVEFMSERELHLRSFAENFAVQCLAERGHSGDLKDAEVYEILRSCEEGRPGEF